VRAAAARRDFDADCWAAIVEALADRGDAAARAELKEVLKRRADWVGSPPILAAALHHAEPGEYRPLLQAWLRSLQWRGAGRDGEDGGAGESFRVLMDHLEVDDCGWCFRATLAGRIDLGRTLKAIESSYACEVRASPGARRAAPPAPRLQAGRC